MERSFWLYFDGSATPNPGPAGIGVHIYSEDGEYEWRIGEPIGKATNNQAEYQALITGLTSFIERLQNKKFNATELKIRGDSELLFKHLSGEYSAKKMHTYYSKVQQLLSTLKALNISIDLAHVPRAQNQEADRLSRTR